MRSGFVAACAGAVYLLNTDLMEIRFRLALTLVYADECMSANIQRIFRSSGDSEESSLKSAPLVRWSRGRWVFDTLKIVYLVKGPRCIALNPLVALRNQAAVALASRRTV